MENICYHRSNHNCAFWRHFWVVFGQPPGGGEIPQYFPLKKIPHCLVKMEIQIEGHLPPRGGAVLHKDTCLSSGGGVRAVGGCYFELWVGFLITKVHTQDWHFGNNWNQQSGVSYLSASTDRLSGGVKRVLMCFLVILTILVSGAEGPWFMLGFVQMAPT